MGLTNKELLESIEKIFEKKFREKFALLASEIDSLKQTNADLVKINKALIAHNQELRASLLVSTDSSVNGEHAGDSAGVESVVADDEPALVDAPSSEDLDNRIYMDVLILSDSIYRHVGSEYPKEHHKKGAAIYSNFELGTGNPLTVLKVVCPGARCDRLFAEAASLNRSHVFGHVVVHVGSNYVPGVAEGRAFPTASVIAKDITDLLCAVEKLLQADVSFSCILPRRDV